MDAFSLGRNNLIGPKAVSRERLALTKFVIAVVHAFQQSGQAGETRQTLDNQYRAIRGVPTENRR